MNLCGSFHEPALTPSLFRRMLSMSHKSRAGDRVGLGHDNRVPRHPGEMPGPGGTRESSRGGKSRGRGKHGPREQNRLEAIVTRSVAGPTALHPDGGVARSWDCSPPHRRPPAPRRGAANGMADATGGGARASLDPGYGPRSLRDRRSLVAFTLIELLVVIAIIGILSSLLLPALSGAKSRAQRLVCTSQMKQLGVGLTLFTTDHSDQYPPTAYSTGDYQYQLSWDDYIHRYIGGADPEADLILGISGAISDPDLIPKILKCPADRIEIGIDYAPYSQRRTYAMNWAGPSFQITSASGALPAPTHGVGIYYNMRGPTPGALPDWEPRGFKDSAIGDPAGTILLAELPNGRNAAGNDWPSFCAGPGTGVPGGLSPDCVQLSRASSFNNISYGTAAYGLHARRFNYLFHDGHVSIHKVTDTVGSGTTNAPKGMWTMVPGD